MDDYDKHFIRSPRESVDPEEPTPAKRYNDSGDDPEEPFPARRYSDSGGALFLLPGSTRIHELDSAMRKCSKPEFNSCFFAPRQLLDLLSQKFNLDFIFIDLGPNLHQLTMAFVLSSDFILSPVLADFYSCSSVYCMLCEVLPRWDSMLKNKRRELIEDNDNDRSILNSYPSLK